MNLASPSTPVNLPRRPGLLRMALIGSGLLLLGMTSLLWLMHGERIFLDILNAAMAVCM
jgi:hypothetical protein